MFGWLKQNKADKAVVQRWRDAITARARMPDPYLKGWVEDTLEGRFHMVALVATLAMRRLGEAGSEGKAISKKLSEVLFSDFDHALREEGVGDSSIARKIRKMGEEFFGLASAVDAALSSQMAHDELAFVLQRNVQPDTAKALELAQHILLLNQHVGELNDAEILTGPNSL